jgi:hypothetical protein
MPHRPLTAAVLLSCLFAAPALAETPAEAYGRFLAANPRYEVLPAPYFEPGVRPAAFVEVGLNARSYLGPNVAWHAEVDTGTVTRVPARGASRDKGWSGFLPLGDRAIEKAEVRLYAHEHGTVRLAARIALPNIQPTRFNAQYVRGPRARQLGRSWGEDGAWLVLIQLRHRPDFWRRSAPVLYVGGDFNFQRIEGTVRFLRVHGVNALGYKPDYDRDPNEMFLDMARADLPNVRRYLQLAANDRPADVIGMCVGGLHVRGLAWAERRELRPPNPLVASVTTVGTPHTGSELADIYNSIELLPAMHRLVTGDSRIHKYKDSRADVALFHQVVGPLPEVPHGSVVLDPQGERPDPRYDSTDWPLRWLVSAETGVPPESVGTDGLITVSSQRFGDRIVTWKSDHAGMINDGRAATYFDAYQAHLKLVESLPNR